MQTMANEWRDEGEIRGRLKEKREIILHLLQHRFRPDKEGIEQLTQRLTRISDANLLNKLRDLSLDVSDLPEFTLKLQAILAERADGTVVNAEDAPENVDAPVAGLIAER